MASIINAVDVTIKSNGIVIGCAKSADFTVSREMDEATCGGSGGWKQVSPGQKSWSASFSAIMRDFVTAEAATNVSFDTIFDLLDTGTVVDVEFARVGGTHRYTGKAFVKNIKYTQPEKGAVTWSADYDGSGAFGRTI